MDRLFGKDGKSRMAKWQGRVATGVLFLAWAALGMAQLDTGSIAGHVTDQSGATVPGATITIRNVETGITRTLESNAAGRYEASALPVGNYEVRGSLAGFQTLVRSGINLTVGRNAVVDLALQVGEVAQAITVAGEASFVETTTATVSNLVDEKRVSEIPLNNLDLTQLAYLQPGVLKVPQTSSSAAGSARGGLGELMEQPLTDSRAKNTRLPFAPACRGRGTAAWPATRMATMPSGCRPIQPCGGSVRRRSGTVARP